MDYTSSNNYSHGYGTGYSGSPGYSGNTGYSGNPGYQTRPQQQYPQQQYPSQSQFPSQSQYQPTPGYEYYAQPALSPRQPSFGPSAPTHTYDTLSQYSATTRPKTEYDYDKIETTDRGVKDYFMKTSFDEFGSEQSRVSKSKFVAALALGGAALFAAKKGYERYQDHKMQQQMEEPMYPPDDKSVHGSQLGYN